MDTVCEDVKLFWSLADKSFARPVTSKSLQQLLTNLTRGRCHLYAIPRHTTNTVPAFDMRGWFDVAMQCYTQLPVHQADFCWKLVVAGVEVFDVKSEQSALLQRSSS